MLGLGNPGPRYADTRHNLGFRVADRLARRIGARFGGGLDMLSLTALGRMGDVPVIVAKPGTFMNRSGAAAEALVDRFDAEPADVLVIHDDSDLELGRVRIRTAGGDGGHNGLASIIEHLGTDAFPRIKLGVRGAGREDGDLADYVLSPFDRDEQPIADRLVAVGADASEAVIVGTVGDAMNRFNGMSVADT